MTTNQARLSQTLRRKSTKDDGFLFRRFSAADAMYSPVVTRLQTYAVPVNSATDAYCKAVLAYTPLKEWVDAARKEP